MQILIFCWFRLYMQKSFALIDNMVGDDCFAFLRQASSDRISISRQRSALWSHNYYQRTAGSTDTWTQSRGYVQAFSGILSSIFSPGTNQEDVLNFEEHSLINHIGAPTKFMLIKVQPAVTSKFALFNEQIFFLHLGR